MLETELYPTTHYTALRMICHYSSKFGWDSKRGGNYLVLDPQAGNGALLDVVEKTYRREGHLDLYAIEIQQELRFILQEKGYKVLGADFLEYNEPCLFDLILMNPPFSMAVAHILKAWEFVNGDGDLCALVNWETIANPYTAERQLLKKLISDYGSVENIGRVFAKAERPTNIEIGLIRLKKPVKPISFSFDAGDFSTDGIEEKGFSANPLAHNDVIKNLVSRYDAVIRVLQARHKSQQELQFYLDGISSSYYGSSKDEESLTRRESFNSQVSAVKARFWGTVFTKTKLSEKGTSKFYKEFSSFAKSQTLMAFNEQNIREILEMFFLNQDQIMNDAIVDVFDKATAFHEKNRLWTEGWKTNKSWRINKRIILPYGIVYEKDWGFKRNWGNDRAATFYGDLDKILLNLSGTRRDWEFVGLNQAIDKFTERMGKHTPEPLESTFFKVRIFKKGTVHLDFKDLELLAKFNAAAAKGKMWLGDGT